jgi:hypothetical protein
MGCIKPKTVSKLMDVANKFADGEETYHNKRARSPKDDKSHSYNNQKRRRHNYESYSSNKQVATGYRDSGNQGDERQSSGYRNDNRDDSGPSKPFRPRTSRDYNQSPNDILNKPCHMHYTYVEGKKSFESSDERLSHLYQVAGGHWVKARRSKESGICRNP